MADAQEIVTTSPPVSVSDYYTVGSETPADGLFPITFEYLNVSGVDIVVKTREPDDDEFTIREEDTHWELDTGGIRFITEAYEPPIGTNVIIERNTQRERVNDYESGSGLTAANLDQDNDQEFFILQEIEAGLYNALRRSVDGTYWNGEGIRSSNCAAATTTTGWVTLGQMQAYVTGGEALDLDDVEVYSFVGDDSTYIFELTDVTDTSRQLLLVTINGVLQHVGDLTTDGPNYIVYNPGDAGHSGGDFSEIVFDNAPADGDIIEVRRLIGTITGVPGNNTVGPDQIQDDAIDDLEMFNLAPSESSWVIFAADGTASFSPTDEITLFESALDTWLAAKTLSDFTDFVDENIDANGFRIKDVAKPASNSDATRRLDLAVVAYALSNNEAFDTATFTSVADPGFVPTLVEVELRLPYTGGELIRAFYRLRPNGDNYVLMTAAPVHNGSDNALMPILKGSIRAAGNTRITVHAAGNSGDGSVVWDGSYVGDVRMYREQQIVPA